MGLRSRRVGDEVGAWIRDKVGDRVGAGAGVICPIYAHIYVYVSIFYCNTRRHLFLAVRFLKSNGFTQRPLFQTPVLVIQLLKKGVQLALTIRIMGHMRG